MSTPFLCRVDVKTPLLLTQAKRRGLTPRNLDKDYLFHSWVEATFGPGQIRPFFVSQAGANKAQLFAYTSVDASTLKQMVDAFAEPDAFAAADWDSLYTKQMPTRYPERVGFQLRVCPTVRGETERDAYAVAASHDAEVTREGVYQEWVRERVERLPGLKLLRSSLTGFQLNPMVRRTQEDVRRSTKVTLPDVQMEGVLQVENSTSLNELLCTGVGRHKAFGFGMLLLKAPSRC